MTAPSEAQSLRDAVARAARGDVSGLRVMIRDCIGETVPLRRRWVARLMAGPIAALLAHIAKIEAERDALFHRRRWNVEERDGGRVAICHGHHDRSENCDWIEYVPAEAAEAQVATLTARLGEAEAAINGLLPRRLCGEIPSTPDNEKVQIVVTFGAIRAARSALSNKDAGHE